jgi:hypothetical protein
MDARKRGDAGQETGSWRGSVLAALVLLGAAGLGEAAPPSHHRRGPVAKFYLQAAGCVVAGSSRPPSLRLVCQS